MYIKFSNNNSTKYFYKLEELNATGTDLYRAAFCTVFLWSELDSISSTRLVRAFSSSKRSKRKKERKAGPSCDVSTQVCVLRLADKGRDTRERSRGCGSSRCAFARNPYDVKQASPCMLAASLATDLVSTGDGGGELRYRCVMCGRGYRSRSSLTRHSRYECGRLGSRYTFTCTICGKYFCRPDHLKQHILNIHGSAVAK